MVLNDVARGTVGLLAFLTRGVVQGMDAVEGGLRSMISDAGISGDLQTVLLLLVLGAFLFGVLRLLAGRPRLIGAAMLLLIVAHTLGRIASGPVG